MPKKSGLASPSTPSIALPFPLSSCLSPKPSHSPFNKLAMIIVASNQLQSVTVVICQVALNVGIDTRGRTLTPFPSIKKIDMLLTP